MRQAIVRTPFELGIRAPTTAMLELLEFADESHPGRGNGEYGVWYNGRSIYEGTNRDGAVGLIAAVANWLNSERAA